MKLSILIPTICIYIIQDKMLGTTIKNTYQIILHKPIDRVSLSSIHPSPDVCE